jgi:catechol 2,3-dioxygenase-like lactoylglutathione lyase family enzyme
MMRPVPLNHVALTVSDRERSAAFYGRHFGLTDRLHDDEHLFILASPDGSLLALREGAVPESPYRAFHFGFQLEDPDEVRRARERFQRAGVPETEWQDDRGFVRVQVTDPDGYRVELFASPSGGSPSGRPTRSRWTSFVADLREDKPRVLSEQATPATGCASSTIATRSSSTSATRTAPAGR